MASILFFPDQPRKSSKVFHLLPGLGVSSTDIIRTDTKSAFFWSYHKRHDPRGKAWLDELRERVQGKVPIYNVGGIDVRKSTLHVHHLQHFTYSARIHPESYRGVAVEKANAQSVKTMSLVDCPRKPRKGFIYERLIDNRISNVSGQIVCQDIRVPVFGGPMPIIPFVWTKDKPAASPFSTKRITCRFFETGSLFTSLEIERLQSLVQSLSFSYAELDVLRDASGTLYVVDVNNVPGTMRGEATMPERDRIEMRSRYQAAFRSNFLI